MIMKIVVGVDGSEPSHRAVKWCAAHAGALNAEVIAVHAIDMPVHPVVGVYVPPTPTSTADRAKLSEHITNVWCAPLAIAKVPYRVMLRESAPPLAIMQVAKGEEADLVVTGRRGRGGFTELVLGSTSYTLSHHLDRPLLIIP